MVEGGSRFTYARMLKEKGKHFFEIKTSTGAWTLSRGLHNRVQVAAGLRYAAAQRADSRLSHPVQMSSTGDG